MTIKSEFDPYINLTFVKLPSGHYCYELCRFVGQHSLDDAQKKVDELRNKADDLASTFAAMGKIESMINADNINFDFLDAKMDLYLICPMPELN